MRNVRVNLGKRSYDILIGQGLLPALHSLLRDQGLGSRSFLVSNPTVFELYGKALLEMLSAEGYLMTQFLIPEGESAKNLHTVENIYTYLIAQRADRASSLIALGGGVTGDVVGFVAATYMRGISYVQIPTTLLAQVDSSVGGKTGVNHPLGKNLIGAFYQPSFVCVDTDTLATLPQREFQSGLYEVLKYGLIYSRSFFDFFEENLDQIKRRQAGALETIISRCCEIKAEVISLDETETDLRRILNFGHTVGHALEAATHYSLFTHGEAVAYGMLVATRISQELSLLSGDDANLVCRTILRVGPLPPVDSISLEAVLEAMKRDKKRLADETVMVLLRQLGQTLIRSDVPDSLIKEAWNRTKSELTS